MSKKGRDYILFLEDILNAIEKIERYVNALDYQTFRRNDMVVDAVVRNFEIIGEAVRNVPEEIKKKHPVVEWKEVAGFRNILIHDYFGVDLEAVWDTIAKNIPVLKRHISDVLKLEKGFEKTV
jgi:uncharacterized protein with HEPN domain